MKHKIYTAVTVLVLIAIPVVSVFSSSAGTSADPVVTKSYVDKCISDAVNQVMANRITDEDIDKTAHKAAELISLETGEDIELSVKESTSVAQPLTYKAVELAANKVMIGEEGTEIIVRSGAVYIYITGIDSILDVTTGHSLVDKNSVSKDHLLVIPRGDGRGIRATENSWVLVKGGYSIEDPKQ